MFRQTDRSRPDAAASGTRLINAMAMNLGATVVDEREGKTTGTYVAVIWKA